VNKYRPDWDAKDYQTFLAFARHLQPKKDGHFVEPYRRAIREY
jgi:hypothetical protein